MNITTKASSTKMRMTPGLSLTYKSTPLLRPMAATDNAPDYYNNNNNSNVIFFFDIIIMHK